MYYKLTNQRLFYKIQQTRQAYVFWNAPHRLNVFMLTPDVTPKGEIILIRMDSVVSDINGADFNPIDS